VNLVANLGFVLFVVSHEFLAYRVLLAVQRVGLARVNGDNNGFVGSVTRDHPGK